MNFQNLCDTYLRDIQGTAETAVNGYGDSAVSTGVDGRRRDDSADGED